MRLREILQRALSDHPDVIIGIAVFHKNGILVESVGLEKEGAIFLSSALSKLKSGEEVLRSSLLGVDLIFDKYIVVTRKGEKVAVCIVSRPSDIEQLDYLAFRLIEEIEKDFFGF